MVRSDREVLRKPIQRSLFIPLSFLAVSLGSCSQQDRIPVSKGTLVKGPLGLQVVENQESAEALCQEHFCEPNYIYTVQLGRRLPPHPAPTPPPTPAPKPIPVPPSGDTLTYAQDLMNAEEAWSISQGRPEIVVAVVDTGVELSHPDLNDNLWVNVAEKNGIAGVDDDNNGFIDDVHGWDFVNNRANGNDDNGHGTHCAGIIAAERNNLGVVGLAPKVKIMALKFLDRNGSGDTASAIKAIRYAIDNGAQVISNSWGGGGRSELLDGVIQEAMSKNIAVVAAAGNTARNNDSIDTFPANYSGVIAVASTDRQDQLSSFSNYGVQKVFVAAPGSSINSTYLGGTYKELSGTSMATPQVSGALALVLSVLKESEQEPSLAHLKESLCQSSTAVELGKVKCGRMDAGRLLNSVGY